MRRIAAVILLTAAMTMGGTGLAWAHAFLLTADPAQDSTLQTSPTRVTATFNEQMQSEFAAMTVVGPDAAVWSEGSPQVQGATVSVGVRPLGPAGRYTVNYRVTSADGHVVSGSWSFTLATAGTPAPPTSAAPAAPAAAAPASTATHALPVWPFVVAAVVLVAAGAAVALRRRS
ncbi:copper resistance protein C [Mycolicibacterium anyangense]|uniref:Copper resistance protein C n=1 Tax=Mycolicibacterium anyangense TaxID=1431246 RepID=A0A6N4W8K9_9MYCO|nr:copper resistance CopC family protein [Mycolicibacterium anyangense]BBZ78340.1 copper resistance protein C [Mycolicibacterium anyangense]